MATITWKGGAGHFETASLWSTGTVPGAGDVALVDASSGTSAITLDSTVSVAGLTLSDASATLTLSGGLSLGTGSLDVTAGTLDVSGTLTGGTLLDGGGVIAATGATAEFDQVAVIGTLVLSAGTLEAAGLARSSLQAITLGTAAEILFLDGETFSGQSIDLAGGVLATEATDPNDGSLFFGPGTTITQAAAGTTARIGPDVASALVGLGTVVNEGLIEVTAGTLALDAEGGAFTTTVHKAPFINAGTIVIGSGATVIDNTFGNVAALGSIVNNGGLLVLKGSLDNSTTTLDVAATGAFSDLRLANTVTGGVIVEDGGTLAVDAATLLGVTVEGSTLSFNALHLEQGARFVPVGGSFQLTALADAYGQLMLGDAEVLSDVTLGIAAAGWRGTISADYSGTATLGASTVINIASGDAITLTGPGTMINNAVINVAAGGRLCFGTFAGYTGGGTINVAAGATVAFSGSVGISALGHVTGSGATLLNQGTLDLGGGTLSSAGDANFSRFVNQRAVTDGTVLADAAQDGYGAMTGAMLETGNGVLDVNSVSFANAELRGAVELETNGTLTLAGNTRPISSDGSGQGTIILNRQPSVYVVGSATSLQFSQSATLSDATVLLGGITTGDLAGALSAVPEINVFNYNTATFASSVLIVATTVNGPISGIGNQGFVVNHGTIAVESGADFFIVPYGSSTAQDFVNDGLITIAAGGTFDVATNISIASLGSITGSGGLLRLDANNVGNTAYDNSGNTLMVGGASGAPDVELSGATISGGAILNAGGRFTAAGGRLTDVTYVGAMHLTRSTDIYGNATAPSLYFSGGTLETQALTIDAGGSLLLGADESFTGATLALAGELADTGYTLSFDAATTVTSDGSVYMPAGHILNASTIVVATGGTLTMNDFGATATAEPVTDGVVFVENGGTFTPNVLDAGQTVELEAGGVLTPATRYDDGSMVVFEGRTRSKLRALARTIPPCAASASATPLTSPATRTVRSMRRSTTACRTASIRRSRSATTARG
jgi:fibronectin-binding autotransporter adhesin